MRRLCSRGLQWLLAIISFWALGGCGGHRPAGQSPFPARINLTPSAAASVQVGGIVLFTATAQNAAGSNVGATFSFFSSDTSIFNLSPNGIGCAGVWDAAFTTCTPAGTGVVQVTASALGASSAPTYVFVHPPIDNVTVTGVLLDNVPIQEPCLSQGQTMTVEAHAFSHGTDVTASVGPFTWSANNSTVVSITPLVNNAYNFATNQAMAKANTPGITQIFASASGVASTSFQQPNLVSSPPVIFDFFETCPIQNIALEVGRAGSQQTSFSVAKGTSQTIVATVTDVMGNSSLPNLNNGVVLTRIPLIWTSTQPAVAATATSCSLSCSVSTPSAGAAGISASCSPPTCNVGFPEVPAALAPASSAACAAYVHSLQPQVNSANCDEFIPVPVYASPLSLPTPPPTAAVSAVVSGTGTASPAAALATSMGCAGEPPATCTTGIFSLTTSRAVSGSANPSPTSPNSMLFDLAGDKVFMGSAYGAQVINPANFGSATSAFSTLGTVTGRVLAVSNNGTIAIFSDTLHIPNQVYVVNIISPITPAITALNIAGANTAAFSPDGLKAFIFGFDSNGAPNLYVYSTLQALDIIPLPAQTSVSSINFSTNGAFAYVAEPSLAGAGPAVSVYNTCNNELFTDTITGKQFIPLSAAPVVFRPLPDGQHFIALESDGTLEYLTASITGIPPATLTQPATSLCPMSVGHKPAQKIDLGQGTIQPLTFFPSADGTFLYVVAADRSSILVYNFVSGSVSGIPLVGSTNPTPVDAAISVDDAFILVPASDGILHQINTAVGGSDAAQIPFPNLPNYSDPFCTFTPASGPCALNTVVVKP